MAAEERSRRESLGGMANSRSGESEATEDASRILVVDDDAVLLDVYTLLLEAAGFVVTTSVGAHQGFEILAEASRQRHSFDLLITDFDMPGNRGNVLIKAVRELEKDDRVSDQDRLPILLLTGVALSTLSRREQDDLMTSGVSYLNKTDANDRLVPTVKRILRKHSA